MNAKLFIFLLFNLAIGIKINIRRMKPAWHVMLQQNISTKKIVNNYKLIQSASPVPLFKFIDSEFYGDLLLGHPGQRFKVIFDSSWGPTWVPSILCPVTNIPCAFRNKYDGSRSSTGIRLNKTISLSFKTGNLTGRVWRDLAHIGKTNITNQDITAINHIPWTLMWSKADGVAGLGFGEFFNTSTILENMIKQKTIEKPIMSFYFNRDYSSNKGGTLLFGGVDKKNFRGSFTTVKVDYSLSFWDIPVDKIIAISKNENKTEYVFCRDGCRAIVDTSANPIEGPKNEIEQINKLLGATKFLFGRYVVPCSTISLLPNFNFLIGGRNFTLNGKSYVQQVELGPITFCLSSFKASQGQKWVIGGAFLSRYYSSFNLVEKTIGFANATL